MVNVFEVGAFQSIVYFERQQDNLLFFNPMYDQPPYVSSSFFCQIVDIYCIMPGIMLQMQHGRGGEVEGQDITYILFDRVLLPI